MVQLARFKARSAPTGLKNAAVRSWVRRWTALVSVAAQASFAHTLLHGVAHWSGEQDGVEPALHVVMGEDRGAPPAVSRLPLA